MDATGAGAKYAGVVELIVEDDTASTPSTPLTDDVPTLSDSVSSSASSASAHTSIASSILGDGYVLESRDGVLTIPTRYHENADLLCPFQILDCDQVFADIPDFKSHVFSHFRGHELPTSAACFLCDNQYVQRPDDDPALAWNNMLSHMVHDHFRQGQQLATVRTDFGLMRWMYSRRIITTDQFKRTQMVPVEIVLPGPANLARQRRLFPDLPHAPAATPPAAILAHMAQYVGYQPGAFTMNAGRRAERSRLDATRTIPFRAQGRV